MGSISRPIFAQPIASSRKPETHNKRCKIPSSQPGQRHRHTHVWSTISLLVPGASIHPNTKSISNHCSNYPTNTSSQCRHRCVQYPPPATDQYTTYVGTPDSNADESKRRGRKNQQPQHPESSHSPGINWTKTGATSQALTRIWQQILLDTQEVCTWRRSVQQ